MNLQVIATYTPLYSNYQTQSLFKQTPTSKMPRQGDGSGDNGPIEAGHDIIHGASGDVSTNND